MLRPIVTKPTTVEVRVSLDASGRVLKAQAVEGQNISTLLSRAVELAAKSCDFRPAREGGKPVPSDVVLRYQLTPVR
jgi:outer membrane biosynthesis protein TonB